RGILRKLVPQRLFYDHLERFWGVSLGPHDAPNNRLLSLRRKELFWQLCALRRDRRRASHPREGRVLTFFACSNVSNGPCRPIVRRFDAPVLLLRYWTMYSQSVGLRLCSSAGWAEHSSAEAK